MTYLLSYDAVNLPPLILIGWSYKYCVHLTSYNYEWTVTIILSSRYPEPEVVMGLIRVNKVRLNPSKMEVLLVGYDLVLGSGVMLMLAGVNSH